MIFQGKIREAISHFNRTLLNKPDHPEALMWLWWWYLFLGKPDTAISIREKLIKIDPVNPIYNSRGMDHFMIGQFNLVLDPLFELYRLFPEGSMWQLWKTLALMYNDRSSEACDFLKETVKEPGQDAIASLLIFLKYALIGEKEKLSSLLTPDFVKAMQTDCQYSWHMAAFYSYLGDKEKSLDWLENSVDRGFINHPFLNQYDPLLENIRSEERFKNLMERVKYEWENFKV